MKPTYFDFTVKDVEAAKLFFERIFNWRLDKFEGMPYDYYRIQAGPEDEPGIMVVSAQLLTFQLPRASH